jgi:hypothetical protein
MFKEDIKGYYQVVFWKERSQGFLHEGFCQGPGRFMGKVHNFKEVQ